MSVGYRQGVDVDEYTQRVIDAMFDSAAGRPEAKAGIASGDADGLPHLLDLAGLQRPDETMYDDTDA
jgi:hypothetical protein